MSHIDLATQVLYIIVFCLYSLCSENLIADIAGGKEAEGVSEHGVEENIWT